MGLKQTLEGIANFELRVCRRTGVEGDMIAGGPGVQTNIFNVSKGPVEVKMMFGVVTVAIVGAATLPLLNHTPTVTGAMVPIATVTASITGDAIDTVYHWNGTIADALGPTTSLGVAGTAETAWAGNTLVLPPGNVSIGNAGAVATGVIDWYCCYVPCIFGARVEAV